MRYSRGKGYEGGDWEKLAYPQWILVTFDPSKATLFCQFTSLKEFNVTTFLKKVEKV